MNTFHCKGEHIKKNIKTSEKIRGNSIKKNSGIIFTIQLLKSTKGQRNTKKGDDG